MPRAGLAPAARHPVALSCGQAQQHATIGGRANPWAGEGRAGRARQAVAARAHPAADLTAWEGDRTRWDKLIAVDVQRFPRVAAGIFDVYRDPRTPADSKTGLLWMVDEIALSAGDEVDVCRELAAKGYDGERGYFPHRQV